MYGVWAGAMLYINDDPLTLLDSFLYCAVFIILTPLFLIGAVLAYYLVRELGKEERRKEKQGV